MILLNSFTETWFKQCSTHYYHNPYDIGRYNSQYVKRIEKYSDRKDYIKRCLDVYEPVASRYRKEGLVKIDGENFEKTNKEENLISLLQQLKKEFNEQLKLNKNLKCLHVDDVDIKEWDKNPNYGPSVRVKDVFLNCPTAFKIASLDLVRDLATACLQAVPAISAPANLRKSFVNDYYIPGHHDPEFGETQCFHVDSGSPRMFKMFFYLNDVDLEGGPFAYSVESYKNKHAGWNSVYRQTDEDIKDIYGEHSIAYATGKVGDIIIANTNAYHKGLKPTKNERLMLTLNFNIHPENFEKPNIKIKKEMVENLTEAKKPIIDFMEIIE